MVDCFLRLERIVEIIEVIFGLVVDHQILELLIGDDALLDQCLP